MTCASEDGKKDRKKERKKERTKERKKELAIHTCSFSVSSKWEMGEETCFQKVSGYMV